VTDEQGEWTICVVAERPETFRMLYRGDAEDMSRFSLGVEGPHGASELVRDIVLKDNETQRTVEVRLEEPAEGTVVSGQLVDSEGKPVAGILLRTRLPRCQFVTDGQGRFSFSTRGRDTIGIDIRTPGWGVVSPDPSRHGSGSTWRRAEHGTQDVRVVAGELGVLTGSVRWDSGRPVTSLELEGIGCRESIYSPEGTFRLEHCPPGRRPLDIRTPEGVLASLMVDVKPGGTTETRIVLPAPDCAIRGRVTDAVDALRSGFVVHVSGPGFQASLVPDREGLFAVQVPPGSYEICVRPPDFRSPALAERKGVVVTRDRPETDVQIALPRQGETPF
jgi:hypothetical protein